MLKALATFVYNHPIISIIIAKLASGYYLDKHGIDPDKDE